MSWKKNLLFIGLIVLAMVTRLLPHAPNFTAVGAAAIFGGFVFKNHWKAFLVPVAAMFLSDLVLNNLVYASLTEGFTFFTEGFMVIYSAIILSVIIGKYATKGFKILPLVGAGLGSAVIFYLMTNFAVWMGNPLYAQNLGGLLASYTAGLPFLLNQVLGTLGYGAVMFGAAYYVLDGQRRVAMNA